MLLGASFAPAVADDAAPKLPSGWPVRLTLVDSGEIAREFSSQFSATLEVDGQGRTDCRIFWAPNLAPVTTNGEEIFPSVKERPFLDVEWLRKHAEAAADPVSGQTVVLDRIAVRRITQGWIEITSTLVGPVTEGQPWIRPPVIRTSPDTIRQARLWIEQNSTKIEAFELAVRQLARGAGPGETPGLRVHARTLVTNRTHRTEIAGKKWEIVSQWAEGGWVPSFVSFGDVPFPTGLSDRLAGLAKDFGRGPELVRESFDAIDSDSMGRWGTTDWRILPTEPRVTVVGFPETRKLYLRLTRTGESTPGQSTEITPKTLESFGDFEAKRVAERNQVEAWIGHLHEVGLVFDPIDPDPGP